MLERFRQAKQKEITALKTGSMPCPVREGHRPSFAAALEARRGLPAVIAEYKRASPSRGKICESVSVEKAAREYLDNGAAALSILTEEDWFKGSLDFMAKAYAATSGKIPILRKDFIFDPLQIRATAATPASAVLLIVRLISDNALLKNLMAEAATYNLECVVEIFDKTDLEQARECGAGIIQVNARDLDTLRVDRNACLNLVKNNPPLKNEKWIAASGMDNTRHLLEAGHAGFDAVLVGTSLMTGGKPGNALRNLLKAESPC